MFSGFGKADRKRSTGEQYEHEAALLLQRRIAEGRPPPDVWRKAEEWRANHAKPSGWYVLATPEPGFDREAGRHASSEGTPRQAAAISEPFVLRLVRLPLAGGPASAQRSNLRPRAVNTTTD